jgi:hypothetical protein
MTITSFCSPPDGIASSTRDTITRHLAADSILVDKSVGSIRQGRAGVVNACDHCGGRFGMVTYRWWGSKFCKRKCKEAFLRELGLGLDGMCRWFGLHGSMILRFSSTRASSSPASASS